MCAEEVSDRAGAVVISTMYRYASMYCVAVGATFHSNRRRSARRRIRRRTSPRLVARPYEMSESFFGDCEVGS